jgi:hypothetical protein
MKFSWSGPMVMLLLLVVLFSGCSTSTQFLLPRNTDIIIKDEKFSAANDGYADVTVRPFFWTGIGYQLVRGGKVVQEGKLDSHFRVASLFWPPYAIFYWPKGFSYDCYDMTKKTVADEDYSVTCLPKNNGQKKKQAENDRMPWQ